MGTHFTFHLLLTEWHWPSDLTSLWLSFLVCKVPKSQGCYGDEISRYVQSTRRECGTQQALCARSLASLALPQPSEGAAGTRIHTMRPLGAQWAS